MGCGPTTPKEPDYYTEATTAAVADAKSIEVRKKIENAALTGGKVTVNGKVYDFSNMGEADYQRAYGDAMANAALEIQKSYGDQYIQQRQAELEAADPDGVAGRKMLWDQVQRSLSTSGEGQDNAKALEASILAELEKGGTLDPGVEHDVRQRVLGAQVARGNFLGGAAATNEARAMTDASTAVKTAREQRALDFLASGASPEDIEYRKTQTSLSNLASFLRGETPTAQFGQLSGANNGAAPFTMAPASNVSLDPNAGSRGASYAMANYNTAADYASQQANPWMAGTALGIQGASIWNQLGSVKKQQPQMAGKYGGGSAWG